MAYKKTGDRYRLGEPLNTEIAAFSDALSRAPEIQIIREALREHMARRLASEPELRRRYEKALKDRMGAAGENIVVMPKGR